MDTSSQGDLESEVLGTRGRARVVREVVGFLVVGIAATATHLSVGLAAYYALPLGLSAFEANLVAFCVAYLVIIWS